MQRSKSTSNRSKSYSVTSKNRPTWHYSYFVTSKK